MKESNLFLRIIAGSESDLITSFVSTELF